MRHCFRNPFSALGFFLAALAPAILVSSGHALADRPLRNMSAGSVLRFETPVVIHANNLTGVLSRKATHGLSCFIRARQEAPYDRVIPKGLELKVIGADQHALSSPKMVATFTTVLLASESLQDVLCTPVKASADPRLSEFVQALRGVISVDEAAPMHEIR